MRTILICVMLLGGPIAGAAEAAEPDRYPDTQDAHVRACRDRVISAYAEIVREINAGLPLEAIRAPRVAHMRARGYRPTVVGVFVEAAFTPTGSMRAEADALVAECVRVGDG